MDSFRPAYEANDTHTHMNAFGDRVKPGKYASIINGLNGRDSLYAASEKQLQSMRVVRGQCPFNVASIGQPLTSLKQFLILSSKTYSHAGHLP